MHLPVTSVSLPVDPAGHYEGFPHFVSFSEVGARWRREAMLHLPPRHAPA